MESDTNKLEKSHETTCSSEQDESVSTADRENEEKTEEIKEKNDVSTVELERQANASGVRVMGSSSAQDQLLHKPGTSNTRPDSATEEELEYESEPASVKSYENRQKRKYPLDSQGKTMYPVSKTSAQELRELTRKHFMLEKNLKIEGIPEQPKMRKRRMTVSGNMGRDKDVQQKRRRLLSVVERPKKGHMPNWGSFGGDATDPLNLNGLAHSEEGRILNLKTPENSPLPTPDFRKVVYVKVPPNIEDPLNLEGRHDQGYINMLLNSKGKKRHRSKKNKDNNVNQSKTSVKQAPVENKANDKGSGEADESMPPPSVPPSKPKAEIPTPQKQGASVNRSRSRSLSTSPDRKLKRQISGSKGRPGVNEPQKFPEKPMFTHGNYNRYYGYRNREHEPDVRLRYFNPSLFENKDVLDIGCNVGHVTLAIAEHFCPRKILGMDIDGKLIRAARQNMRHMLSQRRKGSSKYPSSLEITRGPLEAHPLTGSSNTFPNNILFLQGNYVPASEEILRLQKEEYDTILALSITKWIHLNNGDHGLKLFFQKIIRQLRPGGHLILEPQPWSTYRKRAKLASDLFKNYSSIKLKPEGFKNYLLSTGFVKCEVIGVPVTKAKGFRRPLILFTKADRTNASAIQVPKSLPTCTECAEGDQTECDHIQFTGMRRGAYADRLYDHISYHPSLRMPDANASGTSCPSGGRNFPDPSPMSAAFMPYSPVIEMAPFLPSSSSSPNFNVPFPRSGSSSASVGASGRSQNRSESEQSCSSSGSGSQSSTSQSSSSGSGSSYSEASSPFVNGGPDLPALAGIGEPMFAGVNLQQQNHHHGLNGDGGDMNGDIAAEIVWVNNEMNGDDEDGVVVQDVDMEGVENGEHPLDNDDSNSNGNIEQQINPPNEEGAFG